MTSSFHRGTGSCAASSLKTRVSTKVLACCLIALLFLLHDGMVSAQVVIGSSSSTSTCPSETVNDIYNTNNHLDVWIGFMGDTFDKCRAGVSTSICTQNEVDDYDLVPTVTFFEDLRALRDTPEYNDLVNACQLETGYIPVEVDMELFLGNDVRLWTIKRLFCFPAACSTVEEYEEVFFARMGEETREYVAEGGGRLDFHPLEQPGILGATSCDPTVAAWSNLSPELQRAYNTYNERYNNDCQTASDITSLADYCNTIYTSGGEYDSSIINFHLNDSSSDYKEFENDCLVENNGEICTVDIMVTKQLYMGDEIDSDDAEDINPEDVRVDINYIYNGLPQCFAKSCSYDEKVQLSEAVALELYMGLQHNERRQRRGLLRSSQLLHGADGRSTVQNGSVFLPESIQKKLATMTSERDAAIISSIKNKTKKNRVMAVPPRILEEEEDVTDEISNNEEDQNNTTNQEEGNNSSTNQDPQQEEDLLDIKAERAFFLDLAKHVDPSAVTKEYPHELFNDEEYTKHKNQQDERRTSFTIFEGSTTYCGTDIDQCFLRITNVCLRRIGGPSTTSTSTEDGEDDGSTTTTDIAVDIEFDFGFGT